MLISDNLFLRGTSDRTPMVNSITSERQPKTAVFMPEKQRYLALDVLRGLTIALMVLVNNPGSWGSIYAPFKHAPWNGFTLTDLVFPTFLFVVGNAMSFSLRKFENQPPQAFWKKVITRSLLIFLIGLFLSAFPFVRRFEGDLIFKDLSEMRIMGVLQRIALCYLFAAIMLKFFKLKGSLILSAILLLGYWWIMYHFGDADAPYSITGNAALKFDLLIFDPENLWHGHGFPFDPEGLLSTLPAIVNVILGYAAGLWIQKKGNSLKTVGTLLFAGLIFLAVGEIWDTVFPINKGIWTSSFVIFSTGWDLILLGCLIWIIELVQLKKWTFFFVVFGRNPLFIFALSGLVVMLMSIIQINGIGMKTWIYNNFYLSWLTDFNASLMFAVSFVLVMWLIAYWMDRKKIYIKV